MTLQAPCVVPKIYLSCAEVLLTACLLWLPAHSPDAAAAADDDDYDDNNDDGDDDVGWTQTSMPATRHAESV
eukprot:463119-Pelagomonas_calceolata.AAC.4